MKKIIIALFLAAFSILVSFTIGNAFVPPELFDCEDIGDIDYPYPPEINDIVPPGSTVETTCGLAFVGYTLTCQYDSVLDDELYYCVYVGPRINRCYLVQTNALF